MSWAAIFRIQRFAVAVFIMALLAITGEVCRSQQHTGQISGSVREQDGKVLSGAVIALFAQETGTEIKRVLTDPDGRYFLPDLRYGTYRVAATLSGFKVAQSKFVILASPGEIVDFILIRQNQKESPPNSFAEKKGEPAFRPSGVEGTIAPPGYSTGLSSEEAQVRGTVRNLDSGLLSDIVPAGSIPDCDQESQLLSAIRVNPKGFDPNHALGVFYLYHGDFAESIKYLEAANAISPRDKGNARDLALAFFGGNRYSEAAAFLERMIENGDHDSHLLRLLAVAYERLGAHGKAKTAYRNASEMDPSAQNQFDCGLGLIRNGATIEARDLLASATAVHPDEARLWMALGIAQDLEQRKDEAIQSLLRAVDLDPAYALPYTFLAELSDTSGSTKEQIRKRLSTFVAAHAESAAAHYDYALVLWKQRAQQDSGDSTIEVISQLERALALEPALARAHYQLGVVYSDSGDLTNAAKELREAVRLEPGNAQAHYHLANIYRRNKQPQLADSEIRIFLSLRGQPGNRDNSAQGMIGGSAALVGPPLGESIAKAAPCPGNHR